MRTRAKLISITAGALFTATAVLWVSGCDFTHVDSPSEAQLAEILVKLESATTEKAARSGVDALMGKVEIGTPGKQGAYSAYDVSRGGRSALAQAQAAYVRGELDQAHSFGEAYQAVKAAEEFAKTVRTFTPSRRAMLEADVARVLEVLTASANAALANPEDPGSALLVAIVSEAGQIPSRVANLTAEQPISPVQRFLFGVWLHQSTPGLFVSAGDVATKVGAEQNCNFCPEDYVLVDKFECAQGNDDGCTYETSGGEPIGTGTIVISDQTFKWDNGIIDGVQSLNWSSPSYYVDYVALNPGCYQEFVPRRTSGSLDNNVIGGRAFSNLVFCRFGEREDCRTQCEAEYVACEFTEGQYVGADCNLLQACLDACEHPQGRVYNP